MINNLEESVHVVMNLIIDLVIALYLGQIILNSNIIIELLKYVFYPIIEVLKIPDRNYLTSYIINLFYSSIIGIGSISLNIQYTSKLLIGVMAILNCTSISSNIIYIKNTNIYISKKEFFISYIQRIIIIMFVYSIMYYFYMGYIM